MWTHSFILLSVIIKLLVYFLKLISLNTPYLNSPSGVNISTSFAGRGPGIVQQNRRFWEKFLILAGANLFPQAWKKVFRCDFFHTLQLGSIDWLFHIIFKGEGLEGVQKHPKSYFIYGCPLEKVAISLGKVSGFQKVVREQFPLFSRYIYP